MRLAIALLTLAPLAHAQDELVLQIGDPVGGTPAATISSIFDHGIASTGDWWAVARYTAQNPDGGVLVLNGETALRFGDALPGGRSFISARGADFSARGDVVVHCLVTDTAGAGSEDALLWNGEIVATKGTPIVDAQGGQVSSIEWIEDFALDGTDRILARVSFAPFSLPVDYRLVEIDLSGAAPDEARLLLGGPVPYPDGTEIVSVESVEVNAAGQVMTTGREIVTAGAPALRAVRVDGELRVRTGDIEPTTGATWDLEGPVFTVSTVDFDLDASGEVTVYGRLETATEFWRAIVRAGTVVARTGEAQPGFFVPLRQVDPFGLAALPDGRVFWSGYEQGSTSKILFLGNQPYLQEGDAILGSTVDRVVQFSNVDITAFPENGGFFLHRVDLADGRRGLLRRRLNVGQFGCAQNNANSTGRTGRLVANGSDVAGGHELELAASDLPPGQFGLFAVGSMSSTGFNVGSQGRVCLGGTIGRFGVQQVSAAGTAQLFLDTLALPTTPSVAVRPGDTWHFQFWCRDNNPNPTSNLTDSVLVTFQ